MNCTEILPELRNNVILAVVTYNRGVQTCPTNHLLILSYLVSIFLTSVPCFTLIYSVNRTNLIFSLAAAISMGWILWSICVEGYRIIDTPTNIYDMPIKASKYGCFHGAQPISLSPLLQEDGLSFLQTRICPNGMFAYHNDTMHTLAVETISVLRLLSIEACIKMNHVRC